jgi:Silicon transporter
MSSLPISDRVSLAVMESCHDGVALTDDEERGSSSLSKNASDSVVTSTTAFDVAIVDLSPSTASITTLKQTETPSTATPNVATNSSISTSTHTDEVDQYRPCAIKETFQDTFWSRTIRHLKTMLSGIIFVFCIYVLISAIFQKQTKATVLGGYEINPIIAFCVSFMALTWLSILEGALNSMIGLVPVDASIYQQSHKHTFKCTKLVHKGGNVERFIVGRQYLDLMCVFTTNFMVSSIKHPSIDGIPDIITTIFFKSGIAAIMVTIVYGQLCTQINSSKFMLDSMNSYAMFISTNIALLVELSGVVHATYFVKMIVEKIGGTTQPNTERRSLFFWVKVWISVCLLCLSFVILFTALYQGRTTSWDAIPPYVSTIIFVVVVLVVGMMDGLQIALMAALRMPVEAINHYPIAKRNCDVVFRGNNVEAFLVGRQMFQTLIQFSIARMISFDTSVKDNIFGISDTLQKVFNSGVLGVLITTIVASLAWRVVANAFPLAFLSNPASRPIIYICFCAEGTGLGNIAWVIAHGYEKIFGLKHDDYYLGSSSYNATVKKNATLTNNNNDDSVLETINGSERTPSINDEHV